MVEYGTPRAEEPKQYTSKGFLYGVLPNYNFAEREHLTF